MPPLTVYIADDVEALRALLRARLEEKPDLAVVGEAASGAEAVDGVLRTRPDVLLLDLSMPDMDGLQALGALGGAMAGTRVLVVSAFSHERMAEVALSRGADGYFEKGGTLDELPDAIRALDGRHALEPVA